MNDPILQLVNTRKEYGDTVAVEHVNIDLRRGEFLTLLGASGSGKTTTLSMISGLVTPTSGSILLSGKPLDPLPPYRRNIGTVFQHYALFPHMTVAGNIAFPLEMRGYGKQYIKERVGNALDLVGLPEYGDRYPRQLSGGQQQRVALARAIVFEPPLLLMDEPLGALDKNLREQMQLEIMRMHKDIGTSVIYVTHDQQEALVMSDRVALFRDGRIEQMDTPHTLYERPASRFAAEFIGESSFISAQVREVSDGYAVLDSDLGMMRAPAVDIAVPGKWLLVAIRPERFHVSSEKKGPDVNRVNGHVREIIYLGASRKCGIQLGNGQRIAVLQPASEAEEHSLSVGDEVRVCWHAQDANLLADDGGCKV